MLIVRAPVRISFFGGGTDLPAYYERHGGVVISASINKYFYTLITEQENAVVQLISADLKVMQTLDNLHPDAVEGDLQIPIAAIKHVGLNRGANIFLASEIPPGTGLGSSGAVGVCIVKALSVLSDKHFDRQAVAEAAYHINSAMLGHPGGKQDEYGSAFGGLKRITFQSDGVRVMPIDIDPVVLRELESNIMLFFTGSSRASETILSQQKEACADDDESTLDALSDIKAMVEEGLTVIRSGNLRDFGELLDQAWQAKKKVAAGISNPHIDDLYQRARDRGAIGGKIAGAGGGGFMMLYCEEGQQRAVSKVMKEAGALEMLFRFDHDGVSVVYDDPLFDSAQHAGAQWSLVEYQ